MADNLNGTVASIAAAQKIFCEQHVASFVASPPDSKLGFALSTKGKLPINGLRHPVAGDTNGWYIWCGEDFSQDAEFFAPVHASHFYEEYPENRKTAWLTPWLPIPLCAQLSGYLV